MEVVDFLRDIWHQTPGPVRTFSVAVPSALFGAWLSSRAQARRAIIDELKALGAAHALCFNIANKALALKKQHVRTLKAEYDAAAAAHEAHMVNPVGPLAIRLDLQSLAKPTFPSAALEKIVFEKISIGGEGVSTAISLVGAIDDLQASLDYRANLIADFRDHGADPVEQRVARYLGLVHEDDVDDRFRSNIEGIYLYTDDCIFFAQWLSRLLVKYENALRRRKWHFFLPGLNLVEPSWAKAEEAGLIPAEADYAKWTQGFVKRPSRLDRWKSIWRKGAAS